MKSRRNETLLSGKVPSKRGSEDLPGMALPLYTKIILEKNKKDFNYNIVPDSIWYFLIMSGFNKLMSVISFCYWSASDQDTPFVGQKKESDIRWVEPINPQLLQKTV